MSPDESIHDPARIRALSHPLRLELMDLLHELGEATATECAAEVGESVASCSFHLRQLAKYGFVEPADRRGRERPWRPVQQRLDLRPDAEVAGSVHAVAEIASLEVLRQGERARAYFARLHREPDAWVQASTVTGGSFWATVEEMAELSRDLQQILDRFEGRSADPSLRPPGARQGRFFAVVNPEPTTEASDD